MDDCSAGKKNARPKLEACNFFNMNSLQGDYMKREVYSEGTLLKVNMQRQ